MRKRTPCDGSKQTVFGPEENTGTVQCVVCGKSNLVMKTITDSSGVQIHSVPEHYATVIAPRLKCQRKRPALSSNKSRNNGRKWSGR
jgi:hypothetical protein